MQTAITIPFTCRDINGGLQRRCPDFPEALQRAARLDITEIDGFDNLHDPEGILKDAEEKAAALYGAGSLLLQCQRKHGRASDRNFGSSAGGREADSGAQLPQGGLPQHLSAAADARFICIRISCRGHPWQAR